MCWYPLATNDDNSSKSDNISNLDDSKKINARLSTLEGSIKKLEKTVANLAKKQVNTKPEQKNLLVLGKEILHIKHL